MVPLRREEPDETEDVGRLPRQLDRGGQLLALGDPDVAMRGIVLEKETKILTGWA